MTEPTETITEQIADQQAPVGGQVPAKPSDGLSGLRAKAEALIDRRGALRARAPEQSASPTKPAPQRQQGQAAKPAPVVDETRQLNDELRATLDRIHARENVQATSERITYARRAGLRGDVSDEVAATLVGKFDVNTSEGKNKFEQFRSANAGLFVARETPQQRQDAMTTRYREQVGEKGEKIANKRFGEAFAKRQIAKNFGGKR